MGSIALKVDSLLDASPAEKVVAAANAEFESESLQESAQVIESSASVGISAEEAFERPLSGHGAIRPAPKSMLGYDRMGLPRRLNPEQKPTRS